MVYWLLNLLIFLSTLFCAFTTTLNTEGRIRAALLGSSTYDRMTRPYTNVSNRQIIVSIDASLIQVMEMDFQHEQLSAALWMRLRWTDHQLTWSPTSYDNQTSIRVSKKDVWTPDIVVYNDVQKTAVDASTFQLIVSNTGSVTWPFTLVVRTACSMDATYFPYDQQVCKIVFGSWSYSGAEVDVINFTNTGDLTRYTPNSRWDLTEFSLRRNVIYYPCCPDPYPDVTFYVVLRRKELHYTMTLVVPSILLMLVTIWGFGLPPASGERVTLVITTLLATVVFFMAARESLPLQSETVPLIEKYLVGVLVMVTFSAVVFIVNLQIYHRGEICDSRSPRCVRYLFFNILAPILCFLKFYHLKKLSKGCCRNFSEANIQLDELHKREDGEITTTPEVPTEAREGAGDVEDRQNTEEESRIISIIMDRVGNVIVTLAYLIFSLIIFLIPRTYNADPESKKTY